MNSEPKEAPATPNGNSTMREGEAARKPKDLPLVKSETIVRHGHVV